MMSLIEKNVTHYDSITGEITTDKTITEYEQRISNEPPYIKLYTDDLSSLFGLCISTSSVLFCLVSMSSFNGEIIINKHIKERIASRIGAKKTDKGLFSISAVNKALTDLVNVNIIMRVDTGVYQLNPNYFARGKWKDVYQKRQSFKMTITYKDKGKKGSREIVTEQFGADVVQLFPEPENSEIEAERG